MSAIATGKARENFSDVVNRSAYGKERIVLTRRGKSVAAVVPIEDLELLEEIEDRLDVEAARKALAEPGKNISLEKVKDLLGL
jgi:prevent-host-death family protein